MARKWWIAGGVVVALLAAGGALAAVPRRLPKRRKSPVAYAVLRALERLGEHANPHSVAKMACALAYPQGCDQAAIDGVYAEVIKVLGPGSEDIPPPEVAGGTIVEQIGEWLDSLTQQQRDGLREIMGPEYYDPIVVAVGVRDNVLLEAEVMRLRDVGLDLYANDKVLALQKYAKLQNLLGPKLNELVGFFM